MNELKFNSKVCTSVEQSKRLLKLGLKPETADMSLTVICGSEIAQWAGEVNNLGNIKINGTSVPNEEIKNIPAWSLHRLLCLLYPREDVYPIMPTTAYDDAIDEIENIIKCGGFYKEYLNYECK